MLPTRPLSSGLASAILMAHLLLSATAIKLSFEARHMQRRGSFVRSAERRTAQVGEATLDDNNNMGYLSEITVGGGTFTVLLDTGSQDLVIEGSVPQTQDYNIPVTINYAVGSATGDVGFATVEFAGYTVQNQIYIHAPADTSDTTSQGTLGLGPLSTVADVKQAVQPYINDGDFPSNAGDSFLDRVFQQDHGTANYMAFYLDRESSSGSVGTGYFTISEVLSEFSSIGSMPKNEVVDNGHWSLVVQGATGNNGKSIVFPASQVSGVGSGKLVAVLDSGYTFPQVPPGIAQAFYQTITDAQLVNVPSLSGEFWVLPCHQEAKGAFIIGGETYPISTLDLVFEAPVNFGLPQGYCLGAFQPMSEAASNALDGQADMILGMAFFRSVYTLFNYGDFVDSSADARYTPYIQLLSISPTSTSGNLETSDASTPPTTASASSAASGVVGFLEKYKWYFIAGGAALVVLIVALIIFLCCCRRRRARARAYKSIGSPEPNAYSPNNRSVGYAPYKHGRYASQLNSVDYGRMGQYSDPLEKETPGNEPDSSKVPLLQGR